MAGRNHRTTAGMTIVADVTGRPAHTFAKWAEDHANDLR